MIDPHVEIEKAKTLEPGVIDLEPEKWEGRTRLQLSQGATQCLYLYRVLHGVRDEEGYESLWETVAEYLDDIYYDLTDDERRAVEMYG
jgi:hypothetical protein